MIIFLFGILYQIWFIDSAKNSNSFYVAKSVYQNDNSEKTINRITSAMFVRILNTYAQLIFVLSILNLQFSSMVQGMAKIFDAIASPSASVFDFGQCVVIGLGFTEDKLLYVKMFFIAVFPIAKLVLLFLYRLIFWAFKLTPKRRAVLKITALALFMTELPALFKEFMGYTICVELDENNPDQLYVNSNLGYQCGTDDYNFVQNFVVYPALGFYCVLCPILIFYFLYKNRNDLENPNLRMSLGTFFNEYRDEAYMWGIPLLAMKLGVMFLADVLFDDTKTKAMTIFLVIYFYSIFVVSYKPHKYTDVLIGETIVLVAAMSTIFGSVYYVGNTIPWLQTAIEIAVSVLNVFAIVNTFYGIMKMSINNVLRKRRSKPEEPEQDGGQLADLNESMDRNRMSTMQMEKALDEGLEMTQKDDPNSEKYIKKMKELL